MKPETVKRLQENVPELKELITFLATELQKLSSIDGLRDIPRPEREIALEGRIWAYDTLTALLLPLITTSSTVMPSNPKEYAVDV